MVERSAQQEYKTRLRSRGMCAHCPTLTDSYLCEYHKRKQREYKRKSYEQHRNPTWPLHNRPWVQELLKRNAFTATEAGKVSGLSGRQAIDRMRRSPSLKLVVLGKDPNANHYRTTVYKVQLKESS